MSREQKQGPVFSHEQLAVINDDAPYLLVAAGPGSGKTEILVAKAAHILISDPQAVVCAITFTAAAARQLEHRMFTRHPELTGRFRSSTIHRAVLDLLRPRYGHRPIISDLERQTIIRAAIRECGRRQTLKTATKTIELWCSTCGELGPDKFLGPEYAAVLEKYRFYDNQYVAKQALAALHNKEMGGLRCTHLFVDEAQDLDEPQLHFVLWHAREGVCIMTIGDDDQSWPRLVGQRSEESKWISASQAASVSGSELKYTLSGVWPSSAVCGRC